jgi:hypothetical protein
VVRSTKQKLNTRLPTESELIALDDDPHALHIGAAGGITPVVVVVVVVVVVELHGVGLEEQTQVEGAFEVLEDMKKALHISL